MKITRRKLQKLIESIISEEVDGLLPTDTASQVAGSTIATDAKEKVTFARDNPGSKQAVPYLKNFFKVFFKAVEKAGGPTPKYLNNADLLDFVAEIQDDSGYYNRHHTVRGDAFDDLGIATTSKGLNSYAQKVADTYVGLARAKPEVQSADFYADLWEEASNKVAG